MQLESRDFALRMELEGPNTNCFPDVNKFWEMTEGLKGKTNDRKFFSYEAGTLLFEELTFTPKTPPNMWVTYAPGTVKFFYKVAWRQEGWHPGVGRPKLRGRADFSVLYPEEFTLPSSCSGQPFVEPITWDEVLVYKSSSKPEGPPVRYPANVQRFPGVGSSGFRVIIQADDDPGIDRENLIVWGKFYFRVNGFSYPFHRNDAGLILATASNRKYWIVDC